jgi:hypothetical protein
LLKNVNNDRHLIEVIRKRVSILEKDNWTIEFSWVMAHIGIYGNELGDQLAKDAARNRDTPNTSAYTKLDYSTLRMEAVGSPKRLLKLLLRVVKKKPQNDNQTNSCSENLKPASK